jgi:hypothetical protein
LNLLKFKSINLLTLDFGVLPIKFKSIPKAYLNSTSNFQVVNQKSNEIRSGNNINAIYKIIDDNLNSNKKETSLLSKEYSPPTHKNNPLSFKELKQLHCEFSIEEYIDNNYKEEVIRK